MKLLLAEDEKRMASALVELLKIERYEVDHVEDGDSALAHLETNVYDGAIIDVMMPKRNGFDVVKAARDANVTTPILLLTAKNQLDDKVKGQTANGTGTEPTGTDLSSWVSYNDGDIEMAITGISSYRTSGASKAIPGFDVMDYGQEDYVFGSSSADARHWSTYVLKVFEENAETLSELFNK